MPPRRAQPLRVPTPGAAGPSGPPLERRGTEPSTDPTITGEPLVPTIVPSTSRQHTPEPEDEEEDEERGTYVDRQSPDSESHIAERVIESEMEELLRRRENLAIRLRHQRLKQEIEAMEVEAVGETPAAYAIVEGTTLPTRKRHYSSSPERDREEL